MNGLFFFRERTTSCEKQQGYRCNFGRRNIKQSGNKIQYYRYKSNSPICILLFGGKPEANTPLCDYTRGLDDIGSKWIVMRADGEPRYNILSALDCNLSAHAQNESAPSYLVAYYNDSPNKDNQFWRFERVE